MSMGKLELQICKLISNLVLFELPYGLRQTCKSIFEENNFPDNLSEFNTGVSFFIKNKRVCQFIAGHGGSPVKLHPHRAASILFHKKENGPNDENDEQFFEIFQAINWLLFLNNKV